MIYTFKNQALKIRAMRLLKTLNSKNQQASQIQNLTLFANFVNERFEKLEFKDLKIDFADFNEPEIIQKYHNAQKIDPNPERMIHNYFDSEYLYYLLDYDAYASPLLKYFGLLNNLVLFSEKCPEKKFNKFLNNKEISQIIRENLSVFNITADQLMQLNQMSKPKQCHIER